MTLVFPDALDELQDLACELSELLDASAAGALDAGSALNRLIVAILDDVECEIQGHLHAADAASTRERAFLEQQIPASGDSGIFSAAT